MRLRVRTLPDGEDHAVDLDEGATGFQLLEALDRNPEAHLLMRGGLPVPMDARLEAGDELAVVAIISGGGMATGRAATPDSPCAASHRKGALSLGCGC